MHLVGVNNDFCLLLICSQSLSHLSKVCNPVAGKHCPLHSDKTALVINLVIRIFFENRKLFKKVLQIFNKFFFRHVFKNHCKIVVMAAATRKNKIRLLHSLHNIWKNFIGCNVTVSFIYNAEVFNIKMSKSVIVNSFVGRNFKKGFQMIPVIASGNYVSKSRFIESLFFEIRNIIIYNMNCIVFVKFPFMQYSIFFKSMKNTYNPCVFFYAKIAVRSMGIVFFCNFFKKIFYKGIVDFYIIINFNWIKKCSIKVSLL